MVILDGVAGKLHLIDLQGEILLSWDRGTWLQDARDKLGRTLHLLETGLLEEVGVKKCSQYLTHIAVGRHERP